MVELSSMQLDAVNKIKDWMVSPRKGSGFRLGGFAGSGKSTVLKHLHDELTERIMVLAPTGKAGSVLKRKGLSDPKTIHSYLYRRGFDVPCSACEGSGRDFMGNHCDPCRGKGTAPDMSWEDGDPDEADLIVVDESSMVQRREYEKLLDLNLPILWVGDPAQLEPVRDDPKIMHDPDFVLTEVHRTNRPGILDLSMAIREGRPFRGMAHVKRKPIPNDVLARADVVIAGLNNTRIQVNARLRKLAGRTGYLAVGDKVICLRNHKGLDIVNGDHGVVTRVGDIDDGIQGKAIDATISFDYRPDVTTGILLDGIGAREAPKYHGAMSNDVSLWDYGYCITCHKSQGSEWAKVAVVDESWRGMNRQRWRYTAVTRASEALGFYVGGSER